MQDYVVETQALSKLFGEKPALSNFSIQIPHGGTHAIVGSNGAGKSTLFRLLLGILTPTSGTAKVLGKCSASLEPETRGEICYVNEEHTLPNWMTVTQVTEFQKSFYNKWDEAVYQQVIGNYNISRKQKTGTLSRGERAGLNLAMALAQRPKLLILDEPTLGIDVVAKQAFLESLMFTGAELGTTIIYCSHQMDEIERVADNLIVMEKGALKNFSSPDQFCERVGYWVADFPQPIDKESLPGLLGVREIEGMHHITVLDQGPEFERVLEKRGAESPQNCPVNLEVAVNAFLTKNHDVPQEV